MSSVTYVMVLIGATLISLLMVVAILTGGFNLYARSDDFVQKLLSTMLILLGLSGAIVFVAILSEMWALYAKGAY